MGSFLMERIFRLTPNELSVGALAYADDLTLLAPSPSALIIRMLLRICECFGVDNYLKFNPDKTLMHQIFQTT